MVDEVEQQRQVDTTNDNQGSIAVLDAVGRQQRERGEGTISEREGRREKERRGE